MQFRNKWIENKGQSFIIFQKKLNGFQYDWICCDFMEFHFLSVRLLSAIQ